MIFRYPGGKSKKQVIFQIISKFPTEFSEYREPFVGGGSVYFSIDSAKNRWINDKDENLVSVYLALKNRPNEFISMCRAIEPPLENEELVAAKSDSSHKKSKKKALYNARLKNKFDELLNDSQADPALKYYFINRTVWGGRVRYDLPSRLYFSNPNGWNVVKKNNLEQAAKKLEDTIVTSTEYENIINESGKDVFIYVDPPYYVNTLLSKTSQLYRHNFTIEDHKKLAEVLTRSKHKILISYDDCGFIRDLYQGWHIEEAEWTYCGTSSSEDAVTKTKKKGKELLIRNYVN